MSTPPKKTQLAIIGAGPAGYPAAFLASDLGLEVTLIDMQPNPGGVCLYQGCIPSKALLHVARILSEAKEAKNFGLEFSQPTINIEAVRAWKQSVVAKLTSGLGQLCKQRKIKFIQGTASFFKFNTLHIKNNSGESSELEFENAIIATGSHPIIPPDFKNLGLSHILDSTAALELNSIPKSLLIVGGGYIGLELGTIYATLGSQVSVAEMMPNILPGIDRDLTTILLKRLQNTFHSIMLNTKVAGLKETKDGIHVTFEGADIQRNEQLFEKVLVAVGRKPNSDGLGLEKTKVEINPKGFLRTNLQCQTTQPNIYAIGDVAGEPMLAHKATHDARVAVESITGQKVSFTPKIIPGVVFTDPEIATCGLTEHQIQKEGLQAKTAKFPWAASGRATTLGRNDGFTKIIIDPATQKVLGVGIVGANAGELISEAVLAIEMGATASDIASSIHPHPVLSETLKEAAEVFLGQCTHLFIPKRP
ncbi:MAG TPA: dihydrolipoyl dehydrogenase [Candidatus Omnitrophota bacterium]|nr:dihydrolipoyl dehydrogenase [Candidatus Omnitrophota bacterium]HPD84810.1 dihydrolipoyl dehydrogenase [Candidatus Omnitrophota bacterium]HRZ03668.1 dihydrolipoyl dehydrogenase [Candidatus Omnitrophota bacterium]